MALLFLRSPQISIYQKELISPNVIFWIIGLFILPLALTWLCKKPEKNITSSKKKKSDQKYGQMLVIVCGICLSKNLRFETKSL